MIRGPSNASIRGFARKTSVHGIMTLELNVHLQMLLERFPEPEGRPALRILSLTDGEDTARFMLINMNDRMPIPERSYLLLK